MRILGIGFVFFMAGFITISARGGNDVDSVMKRDGIVSSEQRYEKFLGSCIPVGFYIYLYNWQENTDPTAHDLDDAIKDMAERGFNYLYVGGTSDTPLWGKLLAMCEKFRIAVVPQLDFAYLGNTKTNVNDLVSRAVPFIKKYKDHPALMAFSVCEEPSIDLMPALKQYYEGILREIPDAPLHLVISYLPQLEKMEPPYPRIMGTDRYGFWWEMSGHRATPWYALNWYHSQLDCYYQLTVERGADFQAVFTASTLESIISPDYLKASFYPDTMSLSTEERARFLKNPTGSLSANTREQLYGNILKLAAKKNHGWDKGAKEGLRFWKYYRPPINCVRAMAWLGIMEGARSIAIWDWSPPYEKMKDFGYRVNGKIGFEYINSITGWDGKGTIQLEEFAEFAKQIQRYSKLIRVMSKESSQLDKKNLPLGHELVAHTEAAKAVFYVEGEDVAWQSFRIPDFSGKVVVIVNTSVGSWCEGRSPHYLSPIDVYQIDDFGNLVDYEPFKVSRKLKCMILSDDMECFDLLTGEIITATDNKLTLSVFPGGGQFLFLSPKGSQERIRLKEQFGL